MFLLDVREERRVREVPLAAGTSEFPLGLFLILGHLLVVLPALLFAHIIITATQPNCPPDVFAGFAKPVQTYRCG